jgi:uncharacterized membrane protein YagU involved in acid resistance
MLNFLLETVFNPEKTYNLFLWIDIIGGLIVMVFKIRKEVKEYERIEGESLVSGIALALIGFIPIFNAVLVLCGVVLVVFIVISILFEYIFKNRKQEEVNKE